MGVVNLGGAEEGGEFFNCRADRAGRFPVERRVFLGVHRMDMQAIVLAIHFRIDAADQLEFPDQNAATTQFGIHPQLAMLETIVYPTSTQLIANNALAQNGTLEIIPMETPLMLFIWSKNRIVPVRLTDFSITEEAFDPALNPLRAKVSLGMRVLNVDDLGFAHKGGSLFMIYQQQKEQLASQSNGGTLSALGIGGIP